MKKAIASAILTWASLSASAQEVWVGGVDNNWNTGGNWLSTVAPVSSNTLMLIFGPPGTTFTPTAPIPYTLNALVLAGGTGYAISGIRLQFDGVNPAILVQAPGSSLSNDLRFAVDTLVSVTTPITFTGAVDGAGGMTVMGGSSLTYASNSMYAGTTVVDTGTTLRFGNGVVGPGAFSDIVNNGILEFNDPSNPTVTGLLIGSGSVRVVDHAAGGVNWLHAGTTTIDAGANAGANITNNALLVVNGIFDTSGSTVGSLTGSGTVNIVFGTLTLGGDNTDQAFTGPQFGGAGDVVKVGTGRQVLAHTLTYAGTTTINGGTLAFGNGATGPSGIPGDIFVNAELELNVPGGITVPGVFGTGNVTVVGGGAIAGQLSHTGTTTVNAGALLAGPITTGTALLTLNGTYDNGGATVGSLTGAGTLNINSGTFTTGGDNTDATFTGFTVGGTGAFTKVGTGRQTLAHTLTYSGDTTISNGTLALGNGATGPAVAFNIIDNAALELNVPAGISINGTLTGSGSLTVVGGLASSPGVLAHAGTTTINAGATLGSSLNNNALLTVNGTFDTGNATVGSLTGAGTLNINSGTFTTGGDNTDATFTGFTVGGAGAFTKVGTGRQTLAHTLTYSGDTTISNGTLALGNGATGPAVAFNIIDNAALELNVPAGIFLNGTVTGIGTVTVVGGMAVAAGLTHSGTTTVNAGALLAGSITNNALFTLNGTFDTGGATVGSLTGAGTLNVNSGTFTTGGDNTSTTFTGVIGSAGSWVKTGIGTLTLTAVNTIAGGTTVIGGRLNVNGTLPGLVTVNAGGTLGGTGTVGAVTVSPGGTLSPGLSPGVLNTGNVVLAGVLLQEIEGPALGAQYDNVNTTGTVDVTGATLTLAGVYVPVAGNTFTIISNDGADAIVGTFAGLAEGATVVLNGVNMTISYVGGTGNDVVLTVAPAPAGVGGPPIPTLSQWMLLLLALLMLTIGLRGARKFGNNQ